MGTWTVYTAGADLNLLNAILNGVAMISNQSAFIWSFAALASTWRLVATATSSAVQGWSGGVGSILGNGSISAFVPMVLALLLTSGSMRCQVVVESTLTGSVTAVDNVPFVVAIIPSVGSELASDVGSLIRTAFGNANPSYDYLSAGGNGFLDPMKRMLGARSAIQRLNGIDSEVRALVSSCIGGDSGADYAAINNAILNAGNTGANAANSLEIYGASPTAIGALLASAAANTAGVVLGIQGTNSQMILSCHDAATQVQGNIDLALASPEFARTIQGAVNGMDQPNAGADNSIDRFAAEYNALRRSNSVAGSLAGGQAQANAEMINFLFAEQVSGALNCLQASSSDKATCESAMIQAAEIERNNIQAAANEVPMLQYAGSFGNYMLALIIGLGPVIVMFMMFAGAGADKSMKTAVHVMVWPLLVTNVGAELVNAMISVQFSNFMASIAHGGFLSLATMNTVYKELSLQVGTGSHIMASLPVIMSMIFALGETAALVSVAREVQPKGTQVGEAQAPTPAASAPLWRQSSVGQIAQGTNFSRVQGLGSLDAVSGSGQFASMTRDVSRTVADAETKQHTLSEGKTNLANWEQGFSSGKFQRLGLTDSEGQSIKEAYEMNLRAGHSVKTSEDASSNRQNSNQSGVDINGKIGVGLGGSSGASPFSAGIGMGVSTQTGATDSKLKTIGSGQIDTADKASALSSALNSDVARRIERSHGGEMSSTFRKSQAVARNYQELTSASASHTDSRQEALKAGSGFVGAQFKMGGDEIAHQVDANRDFRRFHLDEGRRFDQDPATRGYREQAEQDMREGVTDSVEGNPEARGALLRTRAATLQAADEGASVDERFKALKFLTGGARAMTHMSFSAPTSGELDKRFEPIAAPVDRTAVPRDLEHRQVAAPQGPLHITPLPGAERFRNDVAQDVDERTVETATNVEGHIEDARGSGLSQDGPGTASRTASNVGNNVRTALSPSTPSRFVFSPPAPPEPPPAPEDSMPEPGPPPAPWAD